MLRHSSLAAALLMGGCTLHQGRPDVPVPEPTRTDYRVIRNVIVSPPDWPQPLAADIYQPRGDGPFPAVLVLYGGGWHSGDRTQLKSIAKQLARRGYVAVAGSYRLAPDHIWPTQLRDVQLDVRWMRTHAAQWRIDPQRIGAWGYSAGAHLAALLGGISARDALYDADARVEAVVAGGTPSDLTKFPGGTLVPQFIGGTRDTHYAQYQAASPVHYVSAGDPPVFLYHGGFDRLVPPDHATDYRALLDAAGVPCELMILRGRGHITAFLTDGAAVDAALEFLDRRLRDDAGP
ncbi:alpha/beta hydrolase [Solimonas marina]|uniref:Alpha/beta hydrolase n=1 Tax=Solimonas marina TaxID=2714601 RepID=A0A969WEF6_9GAMM|nr:alpha/beta hydrolase [Solimonas marina]NKF24610.1 alpha/beta hydrolase [Solimonas marina]